ncbi:MAG: porphobilinogen synthase, partial [Pseudomonadota bacterium]
APSDMMDGRVGQIRLALDKDNFTDTLILSYSAKFASNFYGPFRDGVGSRSAKVKPDKSSYQLSYKITTEAIRETEFDIKEGADMVMVKPAMAYLDIITKLTLSIDVPLFAYQVSGEYAMLKYASSSGCFDYSSALHESLVAIKRAGARAIITYGAIEIAELLNKY